VEALRRAKSLLDCPGDIAPKGQVLVGEADRVARATDKGVASPPIPKNGGRQTVNALAVCLAEKWTAPSFQPREVADRNHVVILVADFMLQVVGRHVTVNTRQSHL
jgi:hypothetical protein